MWCLLVRAPEAEYNASRNQAGASASREGRVPRNAVGGRTPDTPHCGVSRTKLSRTTLCNRSASEILPSRRNFTFRFACMPLTCHLRGTGAQPHMLLTHMPLVCLSCAARAPFHMPLALNSFACHAPLVRCSPATRATSRNGAPRDEHRPPFGLQGGGGSEELLTRDPRTTTVHPYTIMRAHKHGHALFTDMDTQGLKPRPRHRPRHRGHGLDIGRNIGRDTNGATTGTPIRPEHNRDTGWNPTRARPHRGPREWHMHPPQAQAPRTEHALLHGRSMEDSHPQPLTQRRGAQGPPPATQPMDTRPPKLSASSPEDGYQCLGAMTVL